MAIKYRPVQIKNPFKPGEPGLYYPIPFPAKKVTMNEVAEFISMTSGVSSTDVVASLHGLMHSITYFLGEGKIVDLGDFGTFRVTLKGKGAVDEKSVVVPLVKGKKLKYLPGKEFKSMVNKITTEKSHKKQK